MSNRLDGIYEQISRSSELAQEPIEVIQKLIVQAVMLGLRVTRAGLWSYDAAAGTLRCLRLLDQGRDMTEQAPVLRREDFPRYFAAIAEGTSIIADDATTHPATAEFLDVYLTPLGITSMLDAPLLRDERCLGVVCCEHQRSRRTWLPEEIQFACAMADLYQRAASARG